MIRINYPNHVHRLTFTQLITFIFELYTKDFDASDTYPIITPISEDLVYDLHVGPTQLYRPEDKEYRDAIEGQVRIWAKLPWEYLNGKIDYITVIPHLQEITIDYSCSTANVSSDLCHALYAFARMLERHDNGLEYAWDAPLTPEMGWRVDHVDRSLNGETDGVGSNLEHFVNALEVWAAMERAVDPINTKTLIWSCHPQYYYLNFPYKRNVQTPELKEPKEVIKQGLVTVVVRAEVKLPAHTPPEAIATAMMSHINDQWGLDARMGFESGLREDETCHIFMSTDDIN